MPRQQKNTAHTPRQVVTRARRGEFLFHEFPFPTRGEACPEEIHERLQLPYGVMESSRWHLDGIRILHTRHHYNGHYRLVKENADDVVNLSFNLRGACHIHHLGKRYPVVPLQHNMIYSPGTANTFSNDELETETVTIQFRPRTFLALTGSPGGMLGEFSGHVAGGRASVLARDSLVIDAALHGALHEILCPAFSGRMKHLYLLSKSMEILVMQSDAFMRRFLRKAGTTRVHEDLERVRYAGEYLLKRISDPPNLTELARAAGLNEYKLKRGFREVFGHTVFGYLASHRLVRGRQMLLDTDLTVAEIAFELGYCSPQHFNNAFKKQFGAPPAQFARQG